MWAADSPPTFSRKLITSINSTTAVCLLIWRRRQMSSLNVRFAQKTRGKTDLLNCTNLPSSDSDWRNQGAGRWERNSWANTSARVSHRLRLWGWEESWGEAADWEKVTSIWKQAYSERAEQDAVILTVRDTTSAPEQGTLLMQLH